MNEKEKQRIIRILSENGFELTQFQVTPNIKVSGQYILTFSSKHIYDDSLGERVANLIPEIGVVDTTIISYRAGKGKINSEMWLFFYYNQE